MVDDHSYYMALLSNRGYFRLDLVRNRVPLTLAGWTEVPGLSDTGSEDNVAEFDLEIITFGSRILLIINGHWSGVWDDLSIPDGKIAFVLACYENIDDTITFSGEFTALAELMEFKLDSRIEEAEKRYFEMEKNASPDSRIRLAETFAALGQANPALIQLRKAWETRAASAAVATSAAVTTSAAVAATAKELLLGTKLALALELWSEAEKYIEALFNTEGFEPETRSMKAALLYSRSQYESLIHWAEEMTDAEINYDKLQTLFADPPAFFNLLGHAYYNSGLYQKAADAYDFSFTLDEKNGITAKNAAAACELLIYPDSSPVQKEKALDRYLKAGRAFLADNLYEELGLLIPKFRLLGGANWEARALIGKWAFGIEDWKTAREELNEAEKLRKSGQDSSPDPALYFLQALLLVRKGKSREASSLFERAVHHAPDYPLFRFRLAENRFLLNNDPDDPKLAADLEAALKVSNKDESYGWIHNFAAHVALSKGNVGSAREHLDNAAAILGEVPAVRVNRAVSLYLQGLENEALSILESRPEEDPEGLMANCAGNLLVRLRRFEEADQCYLRALAIAPQNMQYRYNRGSCLIELNRYGEADEVLTVGKRDNHFSSELNPGILGLIAFIAVKKGEYERAEAAVMKALKINPDHIPSLLQLGWNRVLRGRLDEAENILNHLKKLELNEESARSRDELEKRIIEAVYKNINCVSCNREWQVERNPEPAARLKLFAAPPDDMPAGTCPACGNTYCVGCRKDNLDESGRFVCPDCGKTLKLIDEGIKALLNDWADENLKQVTEPELKLP
jgi:tetratricopeptide (TPR) repeat protein